MGPKAASLLLLAALLALAASDKPGKKRRQVIVPPPAPQNLTATPGDGQVSLAWDGVLTATSYIVQRGTLSGGPKLIIRFQYTSTTLIDTGLSNGTTYFYVVSAVNAAGEGDDSAEVSATPFASGGFPPLAPMGLTAVPGDRQVTLSWNAAPGAAHYTIRSATDQGGPYGVVEAGFPGTVFVDDMLENGTTYYYVVTSSNAAGQSPPSAEVSATPLALPPAPPPAPPDDDDEGDGCGLLGLEFLLLLLPKASFAIGNSLRKARNLRASRRVCI